MKKFTVYLKRKTFFGKRIQVVIMANGVHNTVCSGGQLEFYKDEQIGDDTARPTVATFNRGEWMYYIETEV